MHAGGLAECLADPSVLTEAQGAVGKHTSPDAEQKELVSVLGDARYRLMIEQIGRDLLATSTGADAARFLGDAALEAAIREEWREFEAVRRSWHENRGDIGESPNEYRAGTMAAEERPKTLLRENFQVSRKTKIRGGGCSK